MADNKFPCGGAGNNASALREVFGVEAGRILDACRDRDCFEDTRVYLTEVGEELIARTGNVRVKSARICGANIVTEQVQFNCGFYSVDVKLYVKCHFEVCVPVGVTQEFDGIAVVEKRVVLYGGESNVNVFRSAETGSYCAVPDLVCCSHKNPEAVVEVAEPVVLGARILEPSAPCHCCCCCADIPAQIGEQVSGTLVDGFGDNGAERRLVVSLGLFSVVRLVRNGQFLVQAGEYCLPDKECVAPNNEDPCATFRNMPFPTAEFCPATSPAGGAGAGVGSSVGRCRCNS